ncbi:Crp/Fnr family transcriptional regulator [Egbenema bharatensis]|uniref:Crp/Fnr family transcriptional regulator n=1 Tax=Egbenema bharatensis TaxID=3463334 RepID=UPI003A8A8352
MQNSNEDKALENFILASLPPSEYAWLRPKLREVELPQGKILCRARDPVPAVYFPISCLLSWTNSTEMGEVVEVGITGNEGLTGMILLLDENLSPWQVEVQLPGRAFELSVNDFIAALDRSPTLRQRVTAFAYLKLLQINQSALCNRFHSIEERLCRWLLAAQDYSQTSEFSLTRGILAEMIGAGRPSVSLATGTLQTAGLIHAKRGHITILDREGMEDTACECYQIVREAYDRYRAKKIRLD